MFAYAQTQNGKVIAVSNLTDNTQLVSIPDLDQKLIGTFYVNSAFVGYKIALQAAKSAVIVDEQTTITATVTTYLDAPATDFIDTAIFEVGGAQYPTALVKDAVTGAVTASIPFKSGMPGEFTIKTVNAGYVMQNAEVKVVVSNAI